MRNTSKRHALAGPITVILAVCIAAAIPAAAAAQGHDHEDGFFLRLSGGFGSAWTGVSAGGTDASYSGPAGDANFAIGGIVSPNLALHGTLFGWAISRPTIEVGSLSGEADGDLTLGAFGAGVTYYFMPVNIYLSGSLGAGKLDYSEDNVSARSAYGFVGDFTVGKEWWVGESWGLGVALGLTVHSIPDEDTEDNWSGGSVAVRFSATMN
jgi:hypothetical protein